MKVTGLIWEALKYLVKYGNSTVTVDYFDPADGEEGTYVESEDFEVVSGGGFSFVLQEPVSAVLLEVADAKISD